jgi:hypothetical protein
LTYARLPRPGRDSQQAPDGDALGLGDERAAARKQREAAAGILGPSRKPLTADDIPALANRVYSLLAEQIRREKRLRGY